jgi:hypothetical protein
MPVSLALVHHAEGGFDAAPQLDWISDLIRDGRHVLWLDIKDPTAADIELLRREFGFHELALEDVVRRGQRAKIEHYGDYCFIVFYAIRPGRYDEISLFVGRNYLVTIHLGDVPEIVETTTRWQQNADRLDHGVAVPVYSLLDAMIDGYFPVIDDIAERPAQWPARRPTGRGLQSPELHHEADDCPGDHPDERQPDCQHLWDELRAYAGAPVGVRLLRRARSNADARLAPLLRVSAHRLALRQPDRSAERHWRDTG